MPLKKVKIKRKDGKIQRYRVKLTKKFRVTHYYDKRKRVWEKLEKLYRMMIVRTYYSEIETVDTPFNEEIADFRVEMVSNKPMHEQAMAELEKKADRLEWIFKSIFMAKRKKGRINYRVSGHEVNKRIDRDEGKIGTRRQVSFGEKYLYDEEKIEEIEAKRIEEYKKYKRLKK
jgi:hypothetical protein